jgi:hypothetical protein
MAANLRCFQAHKAIGQYRELMVEQGRPPEDSLTAYPGHYLTSILARDVRAKGYPIVKDTDPPNDPAHGLVPRKKTGSFANAMLASHQWIVPPPKQG